MPEIENEQFIYFIKLWKFLDESRAKGNFLLINYSRNFSFLFRKRTYYVKKDVFYANIHAKSNYAFRFYLHGVKNEFF